MAIPTLSFGRLSHQSTRTLFGAAALSSVSQDDADRTLEVLLQYGVNHIDVAASYGDAEVRIAPGSSAIARSSSSPRRRVSARQRPPKKSCIAHLTAWASTICCGAR